MYPQQSGNPLPKVVSVSDDTFLYEVRYPTKTSRPKLPPLNTLESLSRHREIHPMKARLSSSLSGANARVYHFVAPELFPLGLDSIFLLVVRQIVRSGFLVQSFVSRKELFHLPDDRGGECAEHKPPHLLARN